MRVKFFIFFLNSFPGATCETLLQKFNSVHKDNLFYEIPQKRENAFIVRHYAGKVKYQVKLIIFWKFFYYYKYLCFLEIYKLLLVTDNLSLYFQLQINWSYMIHLDTL